MGVDWSVSAGSKSLSWPSEVWQVSFAVYSLNLQELVVYHFPPWGLTGVSVLDLNLCLGLDLGLKKFIWNDLLLMVLTFRSC